MFKSMYPIVVFAREWCVLTESHNWIKCHFSHHPNRIRYLNHAWSFKLIFFNLDRKLPKMQLTPSSFVFVFGFMRRKIKSFLFVFFEFDGNSSRKASCKWREHVISCANSLVSYAWWKPFMIGFNRAPERWDSHSSYRLVLIDGSPTWSSRVEVWQT